MKKLLLTVLTLVDSKGPGCCNRGIIEYDGKIELDQLCLEEDSCRHGEEDHEYLLDRLEFLSEITTKPQLNDSKDVQKAAKAIGRLLRACNVKRGLGTIRQDVNVSVNNGQRVELGISRLGFSQK